mgnify:CR=1 FL=1
MFGIQVVLALIERATPHWHSPAAERVSRPWFAWCLRVHVLWQAALLALQLDPAQFKLRFFIELRHAAAFPFLAPCGERRADLAHQMDRAQSAHQDQTRRIGDHEQDERPHQPH